MRPIQFIPPGLDLRVIAWRYVAYTFSAVLIAVSIISFAAQGLNFGIDFTGGTLIEIRTEAPADIADMRAKLSALNLGITLQEFGAPTDVLIRVQAQEGDEQAQAAAVELVRQALGSGVEFRRVEYV